MTFKVYIQFNVLYNIKKKTHLNYYAKSVVYIYPKGPFARNYLDWRMQGYCPEKSRNIGLFILRPIRRINNSLEIYNLFYGRLFGSIIECSFKNRGLGLKLSLD